jgi:HK97 family phage major capsid protein
MKTYRNFEINLDTRDDEKRTVEASVSSEAPYDRWEGTETLSHDPDAIDLSRAPLPLLLSHDGNQVPIGVVENLRVVGRKLRGILRFGKSTRATEAWVDVQAGILRSLSVGYQILKKQIEANGKAYRATKWMPYEVSIVAMPADTTVGIGRNHSFRNEDQMTTENQNNNERPRTLKRQAERETREEIREILAIGDRLDMNDAARDAVSENWTLQQFKDFAMAEVERRSGQPPQQRQATIGMSRREVENYSMVNVLRCLVFPNEPKYREAARFELECSDAAAKASPIETRGIRVPVDVNQNWQTRTLTAGTATDGAELVATNLLAGSFIDVLRNLSICLSMGATTLHNLVGNVAVPRKTTGSTAGWVSTEGGNVGNSEPQFDTVGLTPKTLGHYADMTRNLLLQSTPAIEGLVRNDLAAAVATGIDKAALYGTGADGQPKGISQQTGINAPTAFAAATPTWGEVVAMESAVAVDNALLGRLGYAIDPAMCGSLKTKPKETGYPQYVMETNDKLNGHRCAVSSQVTAGDIFFGNWADLIIGFWGGLDLLVDPYTLGLSGGVRIIVHQSCDVGVRHPVSFAYNNDSA